MGNQTVGTDVSFSATAIGIIAGLLGVLSATIAYLFKLLIGAKDSELVAMRSERDAYRLLAERSINGLELLVNEARRTTGCRPLATLLPVSPEHASPVTQRQQDQANLTTLQIKFAVIAAELELAPSPDPDAPFEYAKGVVPRYPELGSPPGPPATQEP